MKPMNDIYQEVRQALFDAHSADKDAGNRPDELTWASLSTAIDEAFGIHKPESKEALLKKYSGREPQQFRQLDGWRKGSMAGDMLADEEGRVVTAGDTTELMHGSDVRVLIKPDVPADDVRDLLEQMIAAVKMAEDMHHVVGVDWSAEQGIVGADPDLPI